MMLAFTTHSPTTAGDLPTGVTVVGGVVLDLIGKNGARVVSELKATDLYIGFFNTGTPAAYDGNPGTIGIQQGFDPSVINALGGGLSEVAVRITLQDGDTGPGDFDDGQNWLVVNGIRMGNFSDVTTHVTGPDGTDSSTTATKGVLNNTLDTGFFYSNDPTFLDAFYQSLSQGSVKYQLDDTRTLYDNYFDFTQGIDAALIDVGQGPVVSYSLINDSAALQGGGTTYIHVVDNDNLPPAITNFAGLYIVNPPAHGTTTIDHSTGTIAYTPASGFSGIDSFTYGFSDPGVNLAPATVELNVAQSTQEDITLSPATQNPKIGDQASLVATVQTDSGQPITGRAVTFEVIAGPNVGKTTTINTDQNGQATFSYTSAQIGTDLVIAHFIDDSGVQQSILPATVAWFDNQSTLGPATQKLNVEKLAQLVATIKADDGQLIPNRAVTFEIIDGPNKGRTMTATTDQNGQATLSYTSTLIGTDLVIARFLDNAGLQQSILPAAVTWFDEEIVLSPATQQLKINGQAGVVATIKTNDGEPVANRDVTFEITSGPNIGKTVTITTDQNGQATFSYTSTHIGTDTVVARFTDDAAHQQSSASNAAITWFDDEAVALSPATQILDVGSQAAVVATIQAQNGQAIVGRNVTFEVVAGPNQGKTTTGITDQNGQATFTYTSSLAGTDVIVARFTDDAGQSQSSPSNTLVNWIDEKITLSPASQTWNLTNQATLTATIQSDNGSPLVGRTVTFEIIGGPNMGRTTTIITDQNGQAKYTYGSEQIGTDLVIARFTDDADVQQSILPGTVLWFDEKITLSPATQELTVNHQSVLVATINSGNGNLVGRNVTFEIMSGPNLGVKTTVATDQNGQARLSYTSTQTGSDLIIARFTDDAGQEQSVFPGIVTWDEPIDEAIQLNPSSQKLNVKDQAKLEATIQTDNDQPIAGRQVTFEVTAGPNKGFTKTVTTDENGQATLSYSGTVTGEDTVVAKFTDDNSEQHSATSQLTWFADEGIVLTPDTQQLILGDEAGLIATIQDVEGNPIANREVTFEIVSGPNVGLKKSVVTDHNGQANFAYTSTQIGVDVIVARFTDDASQQVSTQSSNTVLWATIPTSTETTKQTNPIVFVNPPVGPLTNPSQLLLLLLRAPEANRTPDFVGASGLTSNKPPTSTNGEPQVVDAAFGSDEIDKTVLLANFLDFVEPEALIIDLGDEPPTKISVDFVKTSAVEVMKPADKPANDASGDSSQPGASTNVPATPVNELKSSTDSKTDDPTKNIAASSLTSSLASNWRILAFGGAVVLLIGAAWTSRSKWFRFARKLRSR